MMPSRILNGASLLAAVLACVAPAHAGAGDPAGTKTFDTWTATCNNLAQCVAVGAEEGELLTVLVARDAEPNVEPSVKLNLVRPDEDKTPVTSVGLVAIEGEKKTALEVPKPSVTQGDDRIVTVDLPRGAAGRGFVEATRNATSLAFTIGASKGSFSLKGMSAALRWIDERQGRAGTVNALVAKGSAASSQVPAPRPVPEVAAAPAGSAVEVAKPTMSAALKAAMPKGDDCESDLVQSPDVAESLFAWKLAPDRLLVFVPCTRGAYNFSSALFLTDEKGGAPRPVRLPLPAGPHDGAANVLTNAEFDPAKMELSEFAKGRGLGDCGAATTWVWTGEAFALLNAAAQTTCAGLTSDDWPNVYRAVKK